MRKRPKGWITVYRKGKAQAVPLTQSMKPKRRIASVISHRAIPSMNQVEAQRERVWQAINRKEKEMYAGKITSQEYEAYRKKELGKLWQKRTDVSPLIYRTTIGHYGGLYVEVPEEHFGKFKALFPPREFPRRVRTVDVREDDYTVEGEANYRKLFPQSSRYKQVFFSDRSKGLERIDKTMILPHNRETNPGD